MGNVAPRWDLVFDLHILMDFTICTFVEATHVRQLPLLIPATCRADHGFS